MARITRVARTRPTRDRDTAFGGAIARAARQSAPGRSGENSERRNRSSGRRGSRHPRFPVRRGAKATPGRREEGRPWPVSDLHLPLGDHGIHLVSHRAALRWSKQPLLRPRGLARKVQAAPRPTSFPQSELRAMDPAFPARLGDVTRFPSAVWFGQAEGPSEVARSPGRRLPLAGSGRQEAGPWSPRLRPGVPRHRPRARSTCGLASSLFLSLGGAPESSAVSHWSRPPVTLGCGWLLIIPDSETLGP